MVVAKSVSAASRRNESSLVDGLVEVSFAVHGALSKVAAAHQLSVTQLRLLGVLRDREPGVQQLAEHLGLEKSSVSGLVDRAEARGLVRRTASAVDGRVVHIVIAPDGRRLVELVERDITAAIVTLTGPLSAADRRQLTTLLRRVVAVS